MSRGEHEQCRFPSMSVSGLSFGNATRPVKAPAAARVQAAQALLDRGWGKPTQPIAGDDEFDPIKVIENVIIKPGHVDVKDTDG